MDWPALFDEYGIEYVGRGPNTKRGEISCRCPWCGEDDPSQHMGINLTTEAWGCLRNPMHRGHRPFRLVAALLGCSMAQARLTVAAYDVSDPDGLEGALAMLVGATHTHRSPDRQKGDFMVVYDEFRVITQDKGGRKYWKYLEGRGFDNVGQLVTDYDLLYTSTGRWADRIIIPLLQNGELIGWTARAIIDPIHAPRYDTSGAIKQTVLNEDWLSLKGGSLLFITEGPFDALKLDWYGRKLQARATCTFGTSMTLDQISILSGLSKRFKQVVILFDHDAIEPAFYAQDWLQAPNIRVGHLPAGIKDPGAMSGADIQKMIMYEIAQCNQG